MPLPDLRVTEDRAFGAGEAWLSVEARKAQSALRTALDDIRAIMGKVYEKYASGDVLTNAEMTRYNRMANLEAQVLEALDPAIRKNVRQMERIPPAAYGEAFFRYAWAIDASQGVRLRWGTLNLDAIAANLDNAMDKIAIERYGPDARILVRQALNKGLPTGKSYTAMAKDLKESINTVAWKALRIIRTEGQTALNAGQSGAYTKAQAEGIEGREVWDATLDGRTRPSHGAQDQKVKDPESGTFPPLSGVRPRYPADENLPAAERIQCRCRARFEVEGYAPLVRRAREEGLLPYQSYETWKLGEEGKGPRIRFKV